MGASQILYMNYDLAGGSNFQRSQAWSSQYSLNMYSISDPVNKEQAIYPYAGHKRILAFDVGTNSYTGRPGGAISGDIYSFYVVGNTLFRVDSALISTNVGTLDTTTGPVRMVLINKYLSIVDGAAQYNYDLTTGVFTKNVSAGTPANPTYITEQQSQTLMNSRGLQELFQSAVGDPEVWNPLNSILINYQSSYLSFPLLAMQSINGRVFCFTTAFIEVLTNEGTAGFSFAPDENLIFGYGSINDTCIAKGSGGAQGQQQPQYLIFICRNPDDGTMKVMKTDGNPPVVISTPSVEYRLNQMTNPQDAIAFIWTENGQTFYHVSFTTDNQTLVYNVDSKEWFDVDSFGNRHIAEAFTYYNGKKYFISNVDNFLYELSENYYTQDGLAPKLVFITNNMRMSGNNSAGGYRKMRIYEARLYAQQGVGIAGIPLRNSPNYSQAADPLVYLSVSIDGGITWLPPHEASLGTAGEREWVTYFQGLANARDITFKIEFQAPVPFFLLGMQVGYDVQEGTQ